MKVVYVEPRKAARVEVIKNDLKSMQKAVEGSIEAYYPFNEQVCIVCNDEGKLNGMELNRAIYSDDQKIADIIAGPFFICDCSGENFDSLTDEQIDRYIEMFRYPQQFVSMNGKIVALRTQEQTSRSDIPEE